MSKQTDRLADAFARLDRGDSGGFRDLFLADATWLGVPGSGVDGGTPT